MSLIETNKQLVRQLWRDLVNGQRTSALEELVSLDFLDHTPLPGLSGDFEGLRTRLIVLHQAFPDFHSTILDLTAESDKVVAFVKSSGTHLGSFFGETPTGRTCTFLETHTLRYADGKLVEHWGIPDFFSMLLQLGLATAPWETTIAEKEIAA